VSALLQDSQSDIVMFLSSSPCSAYFVFYVGVGHLGMEPTATPSCGNKEMLQRAKGGVLHDSHETDAKLVVIVFVRPKPAQPLDKVAMDAPSESYLREALTLCSCLSTRQHTSFTVQTIGPAPNKSNNGDEKQVDENAICRR